MRRLLGILAVATALSTSPAARAQMAPRESPRNASYTLTATLDPVNRLILGTGRLTWRNTSHTTTSELRFHMYWNAWRDSSSSWMRETKRNVNPGLYVRSSEDAGFIDLTALSLAGATSSDNLLATAHYIAPDDGNAEDRTVLAVPLTRPVAPGDTVVIDFAWNARVPRTVARTGVLGNYFFIGQWFPKIGVLEDRGWNTHQFHATTEFFADYGTYDVRLTVPNGWIVGATGTEETRVDNGNGTSTHHYAQNDVHDFAWTTGPDFVDVRRRIELRDLPPVDVRLLLQREHSGQQDRHFAAARATLESYGQWFGAYPYGHLTIVDPATVFNAAAQGNGTDGMEYPTLITAGTRWSSPWSSNEPEGVTVHEIGHQFWYGLVGTNEFEHAWMDEGINTYATARVMAESFPNRFVVTERYFGALVPWPYEDVRWSRDVTGNRLDAYRAAPDWDAPATDSWKYWPAGARSATYAKTALWLTALERTIGWDVLQRGLSTLFATSTFGHPTPDDFWTTIGETSGRDLSWFANAVYRSAARFDYAVARVDARATDTGAVDSAVTIRRLEEGVFPLSIRVTFDDDSNVTETWDGADRWKTFSYRRGASVRSVEVDPDRVLTLDRNYTNNSWTAHPRAVAAATKWSIRWFTWVQNVLMTYAFFS